MPGRPFVILKVCFFFVIFSEVILAKCPVVLLENDVPFFYAKHVSRRQLQAFVVTPKGWKNVALQIDTFDSDGYLVIPEDLSYLKERLNAKDRLLLRPNSFSAKRWSKGSLMPCDADRLIEVELKGGYFAYIADCKKAMAFPNSVRVPIQFFKADRKVESPWYQYTYDKLNHLLFNRIDIKNGHQWVEVAENAQQYIHADVKKFFTLNFSSSDIKAQLAQYWHGSVSMMGLLKFYLKVLAFEIEFSLSPEVQFFDQAVYMPMNMSIPLDLSQYLNPGSGMIYSWRSPQSVNWELKKTDFPMYGQNLDKKRFCTQDSCKFQLAGSLLEQDFSMDFIIPKSLVDRNFYPQLFFDEIPNLYELSEEDKALTGYQKMGVYLEVSKLPKGDNNWDFWVRFGKTYDKCPADVKLSLIK